MRLSRYFLPVLFERPKEVMRSHELMLRAGLVKKLASGIYSYMPLAVRTLHKIEKIIKEEMDRIGAQEVILPMLHPRSVWEVTGRWDEYGDDMFKLKDRKKSDFGLGPTHEEVITLLIKENVRSYKQLPLILYQIQTKFRDEPRPRFGTIRCREFIMKDAYSFHATEEDLSKTYEMLYQTYMSIFDRCGLKYDVVEAAGGIIGGDISHEFMAWASAGEDLIAVCDRCGYKANREKAEVGSKDEYSKEDLLPCELVYTPNKTSVHEVAEYLNVDISSLVKTLIYKTDKGPVACLVAGDREVNLEKLKDVLSVERIEPAEPALIEELTSAPIGYSGPYKLKTQIPIIADNSIKYKRNFIIGANKQDYHYKNVNIDRDFKINGFYDIKLAADGDLCNRCKEGKLFIKRCIEIGHIFKLGKKYSQKIGATYTNKEGKESFMLMGCYGIGVSRIIPAYIEQNNDADGIIWNKNLCPYEVIILLLDSSLPDKRELSEKIYNILEDNLIEVILDDRDERAGKKFFDADLLGIPIQVIVGKKSDVSNIELRLRRDKKRVYFCSLEEIVRLIKDLLKE